MINLIISSIVQLLIFSLIPFLVYVIRAKKIKGFLEHIGIKRSNRKANLYGLLVALVFGSPILIFSFFNAEFYDILTGPESITGKISSMGFGYLQVCTILFTAIIKTALSEEIFFRGFIAKRLIAVTNFVTGNILQAFLFGIIHTLLFLAVTDSIPFLIIIFLFPAVSSYLKVYINEKLANGSIVPGWIAHASGNIMAYSVVAFLF